jgi:hypothetical protein
MAAGVDRAGRASSSRVLVTQCRAPASRLAPGCCINLVNGPRRRRRARRRRAQARFHRRRAAHRPRHPHAGRAHLRARLHHGAAPAGPAAPAGGGRAGGECAASAAAAASQRTGRGGAGPGRSPGDRRSGASMLPACPPALQVLTTIHQPSSRLYARLDRLLLLAEGHAMYSGAADKVGWLAGGEAGGCGLLEPAPGPPPPALAPTPFYPAPRLGPRAGAGLVRAL